MWNHLTGLIFMILIIVTVVCDDDTTQWPDHNKGRHQKPIQFSNQPKSKSQRTDPSASHPNSPGLKPSEIPFTNKQRNKPIIPQDYDYADAEYGSTKYQPSSHGKLVFGPPRHGQPPPIVMPVDIGSARAIGGNRPGGYVVPGPSGMGIIGDSSTIYGPRDPGSRRDLPGTAWTDWDRYGHAEHPGYGPRHPTFLSQDLHQLEDDGDGQIEEKCDLKCEESEFTCDKSCGCIHPTLRCDGVANCAMAEDERDCEAIHISMDKQLKQECEASGVHTLCPTTQICISKDFLCDGDDDCGDYSDETRCGARAKADCLEDQFECNNGLCIPKLWECDGDNDCKDYSDEVNCTRECTSEEYRCAEGLCIGAQFRCDGDIDCPDATDELNCDIPLPNCPEGEFKCKGSIGGMGGPGGRCVLQRFRCDGDNDCGDWSDEENCPKAPVSCTSNEFKCDDGTCIPNRWRCDDEQDCDSGEDEKRCDNVNRGAERKCSSDEFSCQDGRCIMKSWLCDGITDCKRGEDEVNCEIKCEVGQFSCMHHNSSYTRQQICVNQKHVCDGHNDCPGAEDEQNCPIYHPCADDTKCEQLCVTTYKNTEECACKSGFILHSNGRNCLDIDECQFITEPVCSQECINTHGSFRCTCVPGFVLRPDLRTCKALGGAVKLIMANRADIRQVSLSNSRFTSVIKGLPNAIAIDFHYKKGLLFWSDISTDVIKMSFMNGTSSKDIIKWGLESPGGIAIDWIHDLIFWTDSGTRRVETSSFDGTYRTVLAANDLDKPRAIVVHPGKAFVFWSDWGPNAKIERAYMDGAERKSIISEGIFWPNGLCLDYTANRIFWADAKHHVIESANLDGSERKKVMSSNLPHPFALTLFEDYMFWTDWHTKSIATANKITGKGYRHVHEGLSFPMDIHSYHPTRQPDFNNRCSIDRRGFKGGCSHMCLPTKPQRRCSCPIGLTLKDDQKTCTTVPDKLLLIARKKDIRIRQLNPKNSSKEFDMVIPIDGLKSVVALDWCGKTDSIYWTDVGRSAISRAKLNGADQKVIVDSNLISPAGLTLDWITDKLYWTDPGTNRIEVVTTDGKQRALLIWQDLEKPRDIVVDPLSRLIFWSDWGATPLIERASMDGSSRTPIASKLLMWPNGLAIDHKNKRLYFVDGGTKTLEFVNFDGMGRQKLIANNIEHPFGLDVFNQKVFWTDWDSQSVEVADFMTGSNRRAVISNMSDLMDIRVFHRNRDNMTNPCGRNNGGCSHMCLLNPKGYTCVCPVGVKIRDDQRTCKHGPSNYLIFAHRIDIRQVSLDIDYMIDVVLPLPQISNVVALDVDTQSGEIYWADTIEVAIMKSSADGLKVETIFSESVEIVDGLVVDSVGKKLYWTDAGRNAIEVSELNGTNRNVLVWQDIDSPRGISIDYKYGYLFWTDWGSSPRIERADMNGERRSRIITANLGWPNGLTVDKREKRLYWTDAQIKHIESSDFDGNFRRIVLSDVPHPYGLAVKDNVLYWTDWKTKALHMAQVDNVNVQSVITMNLEGLMDVKIVEHEPQQTEQNACGTNNGGCSHLCLRKPNGCSCKCPTGIKLKTGSTTECEALPNSYLLIALRSGIGRISLDTPEMFDVVLPVDYVYGAVVVDFHRNKSLLYYADVNIDAIVRVNMTNWQQTDTLISSGLKTPNGIAVDWLADNLYWSDTAYKKIEVSRLDGSSRKTILNQDLEDPRALILFPKKGFIFWADWGLHARIERCLMDGSNRKVIVDSDIGFPTGLAIDFDTRKLYWADALQDRIEMSDFEGKKRSIVISHAPHPFGFTLTPTHFYWTDWHNKSVLRAPKRGNPNIEEIRHGLRGALEIRSVSLERQPLDWNPCQENNGGCSHLCLYRGNGYVCACPNHPDAVSCKTGTFSSIKPPGIDDDSDSMDELTTPISSSDGKASKHAKAFKMVQIAIITILILLVITTVIILILLINFRRRRSQKPSRGSGRSVLTFSNPNYNGADALAQAQAANEPSSSSSSRSTIWKRFKYDRAQERVYEEKFLGIPETATTTLITGGGITPSPVHPSPVLGLPTIG